ncbi:Mdv1 protein [Saccharomycopsis crataegensis]|uniref:Mdv1 protein n=1 Tax=Saccharomycopsis crataegensis TaxID=43959 RepID=A0AAV5QV48_9ASCO|nr:Mdv1 protein [Saccharomycopsis crataegensis]
MASNNRNNSPSEDLLAATTRLSKAVTSTASALINTSDSSNVLLKTPHYQKAIYDTLIGPHRNQQPRTVAVKFRKKKAPSEFLRLNFSKDEISYRAITHIPDDLLNEIPEGSNLENKDKFTLFQGFNASIPQVNEELNLFKELNLENLKFSTKDDSQKLLTLDTNDEKSKIIIEKKLNNPLPIDISSKKIKQSKSVKNLNIYKQKILKKMHYLEIRKNLTSNEISEIDAKIQKLTSMRDALFQKVAKFEKDEIYLEGFIHEISDKVEALDKGEVAVDDEAEDSSDELIDTNTNLSTKNPGKKSISFNKDTIVHDSDNDPEKKTSEEAPQAYQSLSEEYDLIEDAEADEYFLSQSIYTSLQKKPPKYHKISSKNRKIKPTLQNYYNSGAEISSFPAHEQGITCFDFDYPFGTMVSASLDSTVRVWDLSTQKCLTLLEGHEMYVRCMQMDNNLLVTGSEDSNLKLWDLSRVENKEYEDDDGVLGKSGEEDENDSDPCVYTFESHIDEITALHFDENNLLSGSSDRTIRQWDMKTGHCLQTLDVLWVTNNAQVTSPIDTGMSYQGSSTQNNSNVPFIGTLQCYSAALASGTADGIVRLWDLRSGEVIRTLTGHTGPITCLQFDEKSLITGSEDKSIKVWDLRMGKIEQNLVYDSGIASLQFDSKKIVFTNNQSYVSVYDRESGEVNKLVPKDVAFTSTSIFARYKEGYLVGGYSNGVVKTWAV